MIPSVFELLIFAPVYAATAAVVWVLKRRELRRDVGKKARYGALPWWYRALCPLLVAPLFTVVPLFLLNRGHEVAAAVVLCAAAPAVMLLAEVGAVRWYRRAGLWGAE